MANHRAADVSAYDSIATGKTDRGRPDQPQGRHNRDNIASAAAKADLAAQVEREANERK